MATIEHMRLKLSKEFGTDFSFIICGKGEVLAAHTRNDGRVDGTELQRKGGFKID